MRISQIDPAQRVIRLEPGTTKNGEGRLMTDPVFALLTACIFCKKADDYVFARPNGMRVRDFRRTWAKACETAALPGLLFHDLRRTAARNLRRAGVPETVIMKIGGWRTRSVFERYAIVSRNDIADAMAKLQRNEKAHEAAIGHNIGHSDAFPGNGTTPESDLRSIN